MVLTRAPADNARLRTALGDVAAELVDYPCIETEPLPVPGAIAERFGRAEYAAVMFVSRNSAEHFLSGVAARPPLDVVALGPSTAAVLREAGWKTIAVPAAANLAAALLELDRLFVRPGRVLYVRGDLGEDTLPEALRKRGREVDVAVVYTTRSATAEPLVEDARPTLVAFASPSAVRHFPGRPQAGRQALAIGQTTAAAAREAGYDVVTADSPDVAGLATSIHRWIDHQLSASRTAL